MEPQDKGKKQSRGRPPRGSLEALLVRDEHRALVAVWLRHPGSRLKDRVLNRVSYSRNGFF